MSKTSKKDKIKPKKFQSGGKIVRKRMREKRRKISCKKTPYS